MDVSFIITAAVFLVGAVIAIKIIKGVVKTAATILGLRALVLALGAVLVIVDAKDFRENFSMEKNAFIAVNEEGLPIAGIEFTGNATRAMNGQQLADYTAELQSGEYGLLENDYYKAFIEHPELLDNTQAGLFEKIESEQRLTEKAQLAMPALEKTVNNPVFMLLEFKKGNLQVIEESFMFKAIKLIPTGIISTTANKLIQK